MKRIILSASMASLASVAAYAQNPNITWGAPTTISGTSDVSIVGAVTGTWAPGDDWRTTSNPNLIADNFPVNGVTFNAYGSGPLNGGSGFTTSGTDDRYGSYGNPNTTDANYNFLLQTAIYSYGEPMTLAWSGMNPGDTYQLEFWVNDGRNSTTAERSETLTGGANTSAALAYGTGPNGTGPGQFILGTFVADSTGDETLTITPYGGADIGPSAQVNLLQLRDITPVPEPSAFALLGAGLCVMLAGFRRKSDNSASR
jgi:hypothetical protein